MDFREVEAFIRKHFQVRDRENPDEIVPFLPNPAQHRLLSFCQILDQQKRPQRIICVKSRRVGFSRIVDAIGCCYMYAYPNFEGRVMAHYDETAIDIMSSAALMVYGDGAPNKGIPWKHKREVWDPTQEYKAVVVPHPSKRGSAASRFGRASAKVRGKGRGLGFSFAHFSEAAYYPEDAPFTAVLPALARSIERSFAGLESTGNGTVGDGEAFYKYWQQASEIGKRGDSDWVRFFIPWTEDPKCVSNQIPRDIPRDDEEKTLIKLGLTAQQIAWRRKEIVTTYQGNVEFFAVENPIEPQEAFIAGGQPAFAREEQAYVTSTVREPRMTAELEITSDPWQPRLAMMGSRGRIKIWELPQAKHEYAIGVDCARGPDARREDQVPGDYAAINVFDGSTGEQVAEFCERIDPSRIAEVVNLLGRFYRTPSIAPNYCAMLNIELNANLGAECQRILADRLSYPLWRFYRWRGSKDDRYNRKAGTAMGWEMTQASRNLSFAAFRNAIRSRRLCVRSEDLAGQICASTMADGRWEITHGHDDILVSGLLSWMAIEQYPPRVRIDRPREATDEIRDSIRAQFDPGIFQIQDALARSEKKEMDELLDPKRLRRRDPLDGVLTQSPLSLR